MFQDNGISGSLFSILMIIWVLSVLVFEIPSGVVADRYNRKNVVIFGEIIRIIGYLSWILIPNFFGFAFGFICWGFKSALRSGALEALVYDNLIELDKVSEYGKIISRAKFLSLVSIIIVTTFASFLVQFGYSNLIHLSSISLILSIVSLVGIKDIRITKHTEQSMKEISIAGFKHIISSKQVIYIILLGQTFYIMGMLDEYWGLMSYEMGFTKFEVGIIIVSLTIIEAIFLLFVPMFDKIKRISLIILFGGFIFSFSLKMSPFYTIIILAIVNSLFKAFQTVIDVRFQNEFKGSIRSTVTSFKGFLDEIFCASFYGAIALVSVNNSYKETFFIMGFVTSILGLLLIVTKKVLKVK
ncbi:MFS transporter [Mycoplasmatota bacterium WC44]